MLGRDTTIFVILLQGQFKSIVHCFTCHRKFLTFGTSILLSLPLAFTNKCTLEDCLQIKISDRQLQVLFQSLQGAAGFSKRDRNLEMTIYAFNTSEMLSYEGSCKKNLQTSTQKTLTSHSMLSIIRTALKNTTFSLL